MLDGLDQQKRQKLEDFVRGMAAIFESYIGEVIRNKFGGNWREDKNKVWILEIKGNKLFPLQKTFKRVTNGEADNLFHYYRVISSLIS